MSRAAGRRREGRRAYGPLLLAALACGPGEPEIAPWFAEARRLLERGQPVEALAVYHGAAAAGHSPEADLEAARLLLGHQRVDWTLASLRSLGERFPTDPRVQEAHYQAAILNRLFDEALRAAQGLLETRPQDSRLLRHVGILELKAGRPGEAVETLRRASRQDPGAAATWYALGRALEAGYRDEEAIAAYRRRIDLDPGHVDSRWRLAHLLARTDAGVPEAAELAAGLAAEHDPAARVLHLLGTLRLRLGAVEEGQRLLGEHARRAAAEARREHDHLRYSVLLDRAAVLLGEDATDQAERLLTEVASLSPAVQDERLLLVRAESLRQAGKRTAGLQALSAAVASRPQLWRYRYLRAEALAALGLRREALADLDAVDRLQPFAPEARRLRLELLPADHPARREEERRLEVLAGLLAREETGATGDAHSGPALSPRTRLLLDALQLHPLARLAEPDVIPMD